MAPRVRALVRLVSALLGALVALAAGAGLVAASPPVTRKEAVDLRLAVDASGRAVAAWGQELDAPRRYRLRVAERGAAGWAPARTLTPPGESISSLDLAGNAAGEVVAVWQHDPARGAPIRAVARTAAGEWGEALDLAPAGTLAFRPRVGVGADGTAVAVWGRPDGTLAAAVRRPGEAWGPMRVVSGPGAPDLAWAAPVVAPDGSALLAWTSGAFEPRAVIVAELPAGSAGVFADPRPLAAPGDGWGAPAAALGPDGSALVAWRRLVGDGPTEEVVVAERSPEGTWGAPAALAPPQPADPMPFAAAGLPAGPSLVVDATGRAVAAWLDAPGDPARLVVRAVVRHAGGSWEEAVTLADSDVLGAPHVVAGAGGTVVVHWRGMSGLVGAIASPGADLRPVERLTPSDQPNAARALIGLDGTGGMVAVWASEPGFLTPKVSAAARTADGPWGTAGIISIGVDPRGEVPGEPVPGVRPPTATTPESPRPPRGISRPGRVRLSTGQLRINQRIAQAALRRVRALEARLAGRPVPRRPRARTGAVRLTRAQLVVNRRIGQTALRRVAALEARLEGRRPPARRPAAEPARIALTAAQLLIDQRIAQAALRRVAELEAALA